jgi:phospholipase C
MDLRPGRFRQRKERAKLDGHAGWRRTWLPASLVGLVVALATAAPLGGAVAESDRDAAARFATTTPIKHLVVIYQENVSFDHYFATYPNALNPAGEPAFHAAKGTPSVNGLNDGLLTNNPNLSNPQRLARSQALTCDQGHDYTEEQSSFNHGLMDKFVEFAGANVTVQKCTGAATGTTPNYAVMDYYDGNTVTAFWNYAQRYAMSDNHYSTGFGPSTPGALNLVSGNTFGATCADAETFNNTTPCPKPFVAATPGTPAPAGTGTIHGDPQPAYDNCSTRDTAGMGGRNVGDLLGQAHSGPISWGWFEGGFADCKAKHTANSTPTMTAKPKGDYIPHHEPFQYYASTANPTHLPPTSAAAVGHQDQANHQYDITDFWAGVDAGSYPAVSFLKAPGYQDGHAGYSTPLDEQTFVVNTINRLQKLPAWESTAVVIAYDDSDGWYDHQMSPILNQSQTSLDTLSGTGQCGASPSKVPSGSTGPQQARCGYGPRQPLIVISPFAKKNFVDHQTTDQASILKFIEDNWSLGRIGNGSADAFAGLLNTMFDFSNPQDDRLLLDPSSGQPTNE